MKQYFFRFMSETHAIEAMGGFRVGDEWASGGVDYALDIVGEVPGATGFHVNAMLLELPSNLAVYQVFPTTPTQIFAGSM